jgi:hypothetical protein
VFYSFGISHDFSFDEDLARRWRCRGFAADPTVTHSSQLADNVTFHKVAATTLGGGTPFPLTTSKPALRRWLGHPRVAALKMDCEGCEYALPRDVALEDPGFFDRVDQFAVEFHVSRRWVDSEEAVYALARLHQQLRTAGLVLQSALVGGCAAENEAAGCHELLVEAGIPCGPGKCCHNCLFARP